MSEDPLGIALVIALLVLSLGLHEMAHAWVAYRCGDSTAKDMGRLTPNPIAHIDPFMTIILPAFLVMMGWMPFGGAKPVPVNPHRLRHPLRDMMLVAIAGPLTNLVLAVVFLVIGKALLTAGIYEADTRIVRVITLSVYFNLILTVFNMLPIPPLDGSRVMAFVLPSGLRETYVSLERYGLLLVVGFIFFLPGGQAMLLDGTRWLYDRINEATGGNWWS